jgi:glycine/D-amino acid oxidase-like deaminating enzyme
MYSIWEKQSFLRYDYIIVGSGITGLSAACSIMEKNPNAQVLVLERGILPTGASTKNAGFACIGSFTEKQYDLKLMGADLFLQLIENRIKGLELLKKRLGIDAIDFQQNGGYELIFQQQPEVYQDEIDQLNEALKPLFPQPLFSLQNQKIKAFGFDESVKQLVANDFEGQIDTGKMMCTLLALATQLGVHIRTGAEVIAFDEGKEYVKLTCNSTVQGMPNLEFISSKVAFCTNAFLNQFFPNEDVKAGRGQVICTKPIQNLKPVGVFSMDEGFYYFRNYQNRIIFGGGRNLDFEGESTTQFGTSSIIQNQLLRYLQEVILPNQTIDVEYVWSGIMAFGEKKQPIVKKYSDRIVIGGRLNGMGVALGSQVGEQIADLMNGV